MLLFLSQLGERSRTFAGKILKHMKAVYAQFLNLNPILQELFLGWFYTGGGGGGHKVPAAFFSKTVKATIVKHGIPTN